MKWKVDGISDIQRDILQNEKILSDHHKGLNHASDLDLISSYKENLEGFYHQEEIYWKQRSKDLLLKEGDKNLKNFHGSAFAGKK